MILIVTLPSCIGAIGSKIRGITHPPTYGTVLAEVLVGDYSEITVDVADTLIARYRPEELIVLEYHVTESLLTNLSAHQRAQYYLRSFGLSLFIDGNSVSGDNIHVFSREGTTAFSREVDRSTKKYQAVVNRELRLIPPVTIDLHAVRSGPILDYEVDVVPVIELSGDPLRLRIALVEDPVFIPQTSGDSLVNRMVVREMIGAENGFEVVFESNRFHIAGQIDIRQIEARIHDFLSRRVNLNPDTIDDPSYLRSLMAALQQYSRIDPERIRLVAFVQRETDRAVLQAAVIDLRP